MRRSRRRSWLALGCFLGGSLWAQENLEIFCDPAQRSDCAPDRLEVSFPSGAGSIDISDPVYLLSNLFLGGPPHVLGVACTPIAECPDPPMCRSP